MTVGEKIENIVGKSGIKLSNTDCIVIAFTREEWFKKWNQEKFMQEASSCPLCERPLQALLLEEPRWIPVTERLPEEGYSVLVMRITDENYKYMRVATYQGDCWMDNTDIFNKPNPHKVIAWMPLPEPYKAESEVEE